MARNIPEEEGELFAREQEGKAKAQEYMRMIRSDMMGEGKMKAEGKNLRITGATCFGEPTQVELTQQCSKHSILRARVWVKGEMEGEQLSPKWQWLPVALVQAGKEGEPLFCGLITRIRFFREGGRKALQLEAISYTVLLDQQKKKRSFQQEDRTFGALAWLVMSPYPGGVIWGAGKEERVGRFLLQYEETDWAFLSRVAALKEEPLVVESRYPRANVFIGLPPGRKPKPYAPLTYQQRKYLAKGGGREGNEGYRGLELLVSQEREEFLLGDQVLLQNRVYVVTHKFSHLTKGEWLHDYTLRPKASCKVEARGNPLLAGAAIQGKVLTTSLTAAQLALETDEPGEAVESWHTQPVSYVGGGKGYSGQPEKGDRQYLYFPTPWEDSRYILGGVDAGQEKLLALARQGL